MQDMRRMYEKFYSNTSKATQNQFILKYVGVCTPKRQKNREEAAQVIRDVTTTYFIPVRKESVVSQKRVCRDFFMNTLLVKKDRLQLLCRRFLETGDFVADKRGGDTRSKFYKNEKISVKKFIESIKAVESHYSRNKNCTRQYLSSDLSLKKLHEMYNNENENLKVKYEYFRKIFVLEYNISFGSPATDVCSMCLCLKEKIKKCKEHSQKNEARLQLVVHKKRAAAFFNLLKKNELGTKVLSFDCQKNLILPKLPDQSAYYTRQMYLYNFTICEGHSKSKQNITNTFAYVWLEHDFAKSSNEIASAVFHRLNETDLTDVYKIVLFADGCGGQNKNSTLLSMLCFWLIQKAPAEVKELQITFPVVGHSFMPPDRTFGLIERSIKKKTTILTPKEYTDIIGQYSTVIHFGSECQVYDFKKECTNIMKKPGLWHFKFNACKRFIITRSNKNNALIRGEPNFVADVGEAKMVCKRGKSFTSMRPQTLTRGRPLKEAKIKDLQFLLEKHFGPDWKEDAQLKLYKEVMEIQQSNNNEDEQSSGEDDSNEIPEEVSVLP